ncbi:MAG TPA: hypothetical protein VGJ77_06340 [Gaiellaceae bacterium]|jgi:hypothetical protein
MKVVVDEILRPSLPRPTRSRLIPARDRSKPSEHPAPSPQQKRTAA